jgi:hypothetical protein
LFWKNSNKKFSRERISHAFFNLLTLAENCTNYLMDMTHVSLSLLRLSWWICLCHGGCFCFDFALGTGRTISCCLGIVNRGIHLGFNYWVSIETKQNEYWPNTKDFRLVNYSFNTGNICSKIGQIVTDLWRIFQQQLNE